MYCDFFGFQEKPFHITPNPRFIYLSKNHREVFAHLLYGIRNRSGFIELTGEVGTGKTTVLRTLLSQLEGEPYRLAFIFNPKLSALDLLRTINREFGLKSEADNCADLSASLNAFLLEENTQGRTVILVIDEAQNLEPAVLEQIRLLSNLETETDKLIQIVLSGQPELSELLAQIGLRQLAQRITVRYHLKPLDFDDTCAYVEHRLEIAGARRGQIFTRSALRRLYRLSGGVPRLLNVLGDRALLIAYTRSVHQVDAATVIEAHRELRREKSQNRRALRPAVLATLGLLSGIVLSGLAFLVFPQASPPPAPAEPPLLAPAQPKKPVGPVIVSEPSLSAQALQENLLSMTQAENMTSAFSAVLRSWEGGEEVTSVEAGAGFEAAAHHRGLTVTRYQGSLEKLLRLNTPVLLELYFPGTVEKRYLALLGHRNDRVAVFPEIGRKELSMRELQSVWFGNALIPWKNFNKIPRITQPGEKGIGVEKLKEILNSSGYLSEVKGIVYDSQTIDAVARFQTSRGIAPDGRVGPQTLILLYQSVPQLGAPTLHAGG